MEEKKYEGYVGVFDSGVGGISVLTELYKLMPHENYLYYGDSANAPYGDRTDENIRELAVRVADHLLEAKVKAIVIACNTATSAAASYLRELHPDIPIIGLEPAIKPAALSGNGKRYLVMATEATLRLEKYRVLEKKLEDRAEFIPLPCKGLADRIEKGNLDAPDLLEYLREKLSPYMGKVDGIVLGCTHYPFIQKQLEEIMPEAEIYNGANGAARELRHQLKERGLLTENEGKGDVVFQSSLDTEEELALYKKFFDGDI
ncbi:MAG: glutamate racemase [Eubacterium sp.]|nr:glutamate racemase [Eubacterium sp.]